MTLTVGSVFSGIGGLEFGLEWAGFRTIWQSEIEPYCCRVLKKHWPHVPNLGDVRTVDWSKVERPDLICGGFPCQPVSRAGKRRAQADDRWLWPEMARAVRGLRPRFVLVENVPGLLAHGMGDVLGDLAGLGYDAEWESLPAAAFGAPHLRDRVCVVAWPQLGRVVADTGSRRRSRNDVRAGRDAAGRRSANVADPEAVIESQRQTGNDTASFLGDSAGASGRTVVGVHPARSDGYRRTPADGEAVLAAGPFGFSREAWAVEPDVGRVAHGVPSRVDRLRALGNAVVPQVAEWIGRRILEAA